MALSRKANPKITSRPPSRRVAGLESGRARVALLCTYAMALYLATHYGALLRPFAVSGDVAQHVFWMYKWYPASGFVPGDIAVELAALLQPWGLKGVYRGLSLLGEPLTISRVLPLPLLMATCLYFYYLLREELQGWMALAGTILMTASLPFLAAFPGGFARSFAFPLLAAALFYLHRGKPGGVAAVVILSAILYPPTCLIVCGIAVIYLLLRRFQGWDRRDLAALGVAAALAAALMWVQSAEITSSEVAGPMYSMAEIRSMPEFGKEGRIALLPILEAEPHRQVIKHLTPAVPFVSALRRASLPARLSRQLDRGLEAMVWVLFLGWILVLWRRGSPSRLDLLIIGSLVASVALFLFSRLVVPRLYIPTRYLQPLALVPAMFLVRILGQRFARPNRSVFALAGLLVLGFFYLARHYGTHDYGRFASLYETLGRIEGPALVAAPPRVCNQIPTFSHKSCLVSQETSHAVYFQSYWAAMKARTYDLLDAYFADDVGVLGNFLKKHEIDYLVIDEEFSPESFRYFEPFASYVTERYAGRFTASGARPAALLLKGPYVTPIDDRFRLLDAKRFLASFTARPGSRDLQARKK